MIIDEDEHELYHYGIKRRSGRYPWGSGQTPEERGTTFLGIIKDMRRQGMTNTEIAKAFDDPEQPFNTSHLRATITMAQNAKKAADIAQAERLKEKGMSNSAIAERMFGSKSKESTVRAMLAPGAKDKADILTSTANMLRKRVDKDGLIDVGKGNENYLEMSPTKFGTAIKMLEAEGYALHNVPVPQLGTAHDTRTKVLAPPGTQWKDVMQNLDKIKPLLATTPDQGRTWDDILPPLSLDSKRIRVKWKEDGGGEEDGVIYVRPGAKDLDMGGTHYAQARILVDGTHYLKGMAVLKDNLPPGVDVVFNSTKPRSANKHDAMKPIVPGDPTNPFGSSINRQVKHDSGPNKGKLKSAINIVNEDANWDDWSRNLSSQFLSKQKPELVKSQLDVTYAKKKAQLDEILALNNPTVRERLLRSYADDMDASAVHLKAAAMPKQKTHVILPINSLKEHEIYAPGYRDGETVALIRYPHGGKFEIPELTVNNRNAQGKKIIHPDSRAAVGINHKVAARLSGADFDGDTVVVIPNNRKRISTEPPLAKLAGFDPQHEYPGYPGMKKMSNTQTQMGMISNLITDMTIKGANHDELARAVRHSMVVIDAEKKGLDYKRSAIEHDIAGLRKKYQPSRAQGGASTIISKIGGKVDVPARRLRRVSEVDPVTGKRGPIDPETGKLQWVPSEKTKSKRVVDPKTGEATWVKVPTTQKIERGHLTEDSFSLIDGEGLPVERMYADYSNKVRDLANQARKEMVNNTKPLPYSPSAKQVHAKEVASLNAKLNTALKNKPLERQAQIIAGAKVKLRKADTPDMDPDVLKKITSQELKKARAKTGALKQQVKITDAEWAAIQAGAITGHKLKEILDNADIDQVKELATPRVTRGLSPTAISRARALVNAGYTQAEIADELGISPSQLRRGLAG